MQYVRIYTGSDGETHFEDLEVELAEVDFAPPAPPVQLSEFTAAKQWMFFAIPPGWVGDWHPTPTRQAFFYLSARWRLRSAMAKFDASDPVTSPSLKIRRVKGIAAEQSGTRPHFRLACRCLTMSSVAWTMTPIDFVRPKQIVAT